MAVIRARAKTAVKPRYGRPLMAASDQVTLPDLPALRERSRDLIRNAPLATGAINTVVVTNVVGTGQSAIPPGS